MQYSGIKFWAILFTNVVFMVHCLFISELGVYVLKITLFFRTFSPLAYWKKFQQLRMTTR